MVKDWINDSDNTKTGIEKDWLSNLTRLDRPNLPAIWPIRLR